MNILQRNRRRVAPLAAAMVAATPWLFGLWSAWLSIIGFFVLWRVFKNWLKPDRTLEEILSTTGSLRVDPQLLARELTSARERVRRIRKEAFRTRSPRIMRSLRSITDSARRMIDDVMKHPNDFPRVERALTGHLAHVETITDSLTNVREVREVDPAVLARLEQTLADLDQLFKDYREKLVEADELELEVRMDLLENELQRLGGRKQPVRN